MNCRPGDLARIVGLPGELRLNDHFVSLADQPPFMVHGCPHWALEKPLDFTLGIGGTNSVTGERFYAGQPVRITELPDYCLRPIRDPGPDAVDEMVRGVSCVVKRTGEVAA
jgi:hypothetical protein